MPEIPEPNPNLTQDQALTMILSSIALEEVALSHIINAEGEKIQYILGKQSACGDSADLEEVLAVNKSVTCLLEMVMQTQLILKNKMERVLEYLPKPCLPIGLPCPPPAPPGSPPCPPGCCRPGACPVPICFAVLPDCYSCGSPLRWTEESACQEGAIRTLDSSRIQLPRTGWVEINLFLELIPFSALGRLGTVELLINCGEKGSITKLFCQRQSADGSPILVGSTCIQMPSACAACTACVTVRAPHEMRVKQGELCVTPVLK